MIGVTGGLGTGKSTVSKILAYALGTEVIDTDQLCRAHLQQGAEGLKKLTTLLGSQFLQSDGSLNRELLRQCVFDDQQVKDTLEKILHPLVSRDLQSYQRDRSEDSRNLVVEVPLLFEVGWQDYFDYTLVVYVPPAMCVDRVVLRDSFSKQLIKKIMSSQMEIEQKRSLADYNVDNSTTFASTMQQIHWVARSLKGRKNSGHSG